ncbi:TetR/AcrR family transcriptional regulator [Nocardia amikacinitolerans]|uniref:TetR/AcrR family transcriptional regulator n=1 Tax=Nocardia amikacinitolerans TaxID=756689 RepID=UPI0020A5EBF6|nr:TetR/AcrR family transcriptional regulator [Nocardia amikacinitolerans]MCP2291704.1 transcriptional regulator, TetR family [Nocardia amikacinitolerans]
MTERVRETQAQRRARMRTRLLDAAIESLVEVGYAGTTTLEVQNRAGVPRGTLQHHFPTKPDLLAGAVEHLAARRLEQLTTEFAAIPEDVDRLATAVELTMRMFSGSSFLAALEIWVGARTDAELRAAFLPLEQRLFELMHTSIRDIFRAEFPDDPRVPTITEFTIEIMTGLAMRALLTGNVERNRILQQRWTNAVRVLLGTAPPGTLLDPRPV